MLKYSYVRIVYNVYFINTHKATNKESKYFENVYGF